MNKLVKGALALAAVIGAVSPVIGHGGGRAVSHSSVPVYSTAGGDCGGSAVAGGAAASSASGPALSSGSADGCGGGVSYVDQVVTGYRAETRTRTVNQTVSRLVTREVPETYTYTENVPVTVAEKQTRTVYKTVSKQVPYTYTVQ
ncbi:MAG: hypothetical protein ACRC33_00470, partial [Gemmataceae bacterium]